MLGSKSTTMQYMIRLTAAVVTSIYLLSTFLVTFHAFVVEHDTCPEHGELIHVDATHDTHEHLVLIEEDTHQSDVTIHAVPEHGDDAHLHCSVLTFFNHDVAISAKHSSGWERSVVLFQHQSWLPDSAIPLSIPLYMLAPKTSPPTA